MTPHSITLAKSSIAAILTIVGYSLNETVVVLDRIREVMRKYKRLSTAEIIDMSVNAVLPRTIMTATTVFLALLNHNPHPTVEEARLAMSGNLCRCGAYDHYLRGVMRAAGEA